MKGMSAAGTDLYKSALRGGQIFTTISTFFRLQLNLHRQLMHRLCIFVVVLVWSLLAHGHHWVTDAYDETDRTTIEIEIVEFRFINPHPFIIAKLTNAHDQRFLEGVETGELWTLEMDNKWELAELGFTNNTFKPGERIIVTVNPSARTTLVRYTSEHLNIRVTVLDMSTMCVSCFYLRHHHLHTHSGTQFYRVLIMQKLTASEIRTHS